MIIPSGLSDLSANASSEAIMLMDHDPFHLEYKYNSESAPEGEIVLLHEAESFSPVDISPEDGEEFEGTSDPRFFFGGGGYGCSCKQHKLCKKKAKKKCCCKKDGYLPALEDILYQLIIVALLGALIFFQANGRRKRRRRSLRFLRGPPDNPSKICPLARPVIDYEDTSTSTTWSHPLDRVNHILAQVEYRFPD